MSVRPDRVVLLLAGLALLSVATAAEAQAPGSLRVTVRDATDLPIAGATVSVTRADPAPAAAAGQPPDVGVPSFEAMTASDGRATVEALRPGVYRATIAAPGFRNIDLTGLSIRSGSRLNRDVRLDIAGFVEQLDVAPPAEDRQVLDAFTTELTPDQIAALPEDPEELLLVLQQMAGGDAEIRVDGFAGALPPGVRIEDIRIRWDGGGAGSSGGGPRIDIRTRPGGDRWRSNANLSLRDERLNARNAFSSERPSGQTRQYGWSLNGPLVRNRTGLSLSIDGSEALEQQVVRAALAGGSLVTSLVDQPATRLMLSARLDHALNDAQTVSLEFRRGVNEARNQGIGEFDLPERAYERQGDNGRLRLSHRTVERAFVNSFRFQFAWDDAESQPASFAPAIRVLDAHTSGGAQVQGGRRTRDFEIENEVEFTARRAHQITAGLTFAGATERGDEWRNAAGTFTFASLEAFEAGRPTTFTQRVGDPAFGYSVHELAWHVQDDYRVRRNLVVNLGLRHQLQSSLRDRVNLAPRVGVNWTPFAGRRTTLRASFGVFHESLSSSLYEQMLLVDGERQHDLVIADPSWPDPSLGGVLQASRPPGIIRARDDLVMPSVRQVQVGVNQPLASWARLRTTYTRRDGRNLFRSRDVNAPVDGVRPDPAYRTVTALESTARSLSHAFETELSLTFEPRRLRSEIAYEWRRVSDETDGALTLPPDSFDLSGEWGRSRQDIPHRLDLSASGDLPAGFRVNAAFRAQSGTPYTVTTGLDGNGDGISNERPEGVGRNTARGTATKNLDLTLTWGIGFGQRPPVEGGQAPGGRGGSRGGGDARSRLEVYARMTNALNFVNPQRFSGVLTSPFFGTATSAGAPRRIVLGTRLTF
jgi:hypothetical protein